MVYFCNYDSTVSPAPVSRFMQCLPNLDDIKQQGILGVPSYPDQGIIKEFNVAQRTTPYMTEDIPDDELVDEDEAGTERGDFTKESKIPNETMPWRYEGCYTRRTLFVISALLSCCVSLLIIAVILRSMREEPRLGANATLNLLLDGEICEEHDECDSGLCGGNEAPYSCQPRVKGCQPCHQDRNCFSGKCVLRSGQSICASTLDGRMDNGCSCDVDEQCHSHSCVGELRPFTCIEPPTSCLIDTDCPNGRVCSFGECSDNATTTNTSSTKQPSGEGCSADSDCASRICVVHSSGIFGVCSSGAIGSICETGFDCGTERCSEGLCASPQVPGGPCKGNSECSSGVCLGFTSENNGLCLDTSDDNTCDAEGAACGQSGRCVGGFCKDFSLMQGSVCTEDADCLSAACAWSSLRSERLCE